MDSMFKNRNRRGQFEAGPSYESRNNHGYRNPPSFERRFPRDPEYQTKRTTQASKWHDKEGRQPKGNYRLSRSNSGSSESSSLRLTESTKFKNYVCPNCKLPYNYIINSNSLTGKVPRILPCKHTICEECIKKSIQTKNHVQCTICLNTEFDKNHFYEYNHYILGQITCSRFNKAVMDFPNIVLTSDSKNRTSSENKKLAITSHTNEKCGFTSCMNSGTISCTECRGVYCESCDDALHKSGKQLQSHKRVLLQNAPLVLQRCPDHSIDEELFCNDCGVNCCCYCILEKHEGHSRSYLSRLNDEEEVALKNAYENAKIKKQQLLVSSWKVSKMEQTNMMSELEIEIAQQFADIHAQLYFMEKNLYQQAKQMQDSHFCLAGLTETINSNIQTIDKLINYVEERKTVKYNMKMLLYKLKDMENLPTILISSETVEKPKLVIDDTVKDLEKYVMLEIPDTVTFELINTDEVPKEYQEEEMKQAKIEIEAQSSRSKSSINTEISNNSRSRQNYEVRDNDFFRRQAVYVTHINSLDSFYVQLKENDNRFKQMEQEIRNHISTMLLGVGEVHMKELYLAKGIGDKNKWCRVRVMEKIGEKYKAKFIDFGYSTIVTKDELIYISSSLASKKPFAYECRLDNPSHFQWPKDTHLELAKFLDINKELDMETKEFSNNIRTVVLNINTSIGGSCSVTELLIFGCDALRKGTKIPEPMKENLNSNKIHDNSDVYIVNNSYDVFLRYVFDPWHIYIQKSNYEKSFNNLIKQMTGYYSKTQCDIHLPIKNSFVVVNYRTKYFGEWHRAKILEVITKKRIVNVYLVDIGEYINVLWKDIRKLFEGFKKSECFVVCAKLADVAPLTNNDWTITDEVAIRQFFESFLKRNVKMKILVSHNDPLEVVLFKPEETFDVNLNAELVENNFALSSGKLTDTKIWLHNEEYEKKEENNFLFFKDDTDDEDCDTEMRGPIQQVEIIHFENPDSFFVSFVSKKASAEKLHEEMQIHYKSLKHHPQERNWKVNDKAVIFDESDKMYYRGIIRVIDGNEHCVHFLDKPGYLWVGTEKLRIIQPYFMKNFPNTVFRCHLVNIKPAGDSNKWSNLSVEWFQMLFKKHQDIFIKKIADDESKSSMPVTIWYSKIIQGSALEPSYRKYISIDKKVVEAGLAFWVPNAVPPEPSLPDKEETTTGSEPDSESTTTTCDECDHKSSDTETTDSEATVIPKIGEVKFIDVKHWLSPSKFTRREFFAYVTCAENEGYLYIREEELQKSYEDMQQKITKHFDNIPFSPFVLREDQMVTVRSEGFWYRGVVLSVINKKTAKIMMVDFGSDHIVEINDLRNKIMYPKIPIMVSKIKLYDIHSKNKGWTLSEIETLLSTAPPYGKIVMRSNLSDAIPLADVYDTKGVCLSDRLVALCPNLYRLVNMPKIVTKNENIEVTNEIVQNYSESQSKESDESCEIIPSDFMSDVEQIRKLEENMEEMPIDPTDEETSEEEEIEKDSSEQEDAEDSEQVEENAILESEGEEEHGDLIADEVVPKRFNYAELTKATMERDIISVYDYKTISFYHPDENSTETEFETLTKSIRDNIEDVEPLSKAEIGQPCLCLFEEDNQWYRAKITRVDALECGYVSVIYVDYGNFEVVKFSNLKTIKSEWLEFPVRFVDAIIDYKLLQTDQENVLLKHIQSLAGKTKYIEIIYDDPVIIHVYNENDDTFQLYYDAFIKNGIVQI